MSAVLPRGNPSRSFPGTREPSFCGKVWVPASAVGDWRTNSRSFHRASALAVGLARRPHGFPGIGTGFGVRLLFQTFHGLVIGFLVFGPFSILALVFEIERGFLRTQAELRIG